MVSKEVVQKAFVGFDEFGGLTICGDQRCVGSAGRDG